MVWPPLTPLTLRVLLTLFVAFAGLALAESLTSLPLSALLALDTRSLGLHTAWQALAWPFVVPFHGGAILDLALALFFLYLVLAPYDARYGTRRTLALLALCWVGATLGALGGDSLFALVFSMPVSPLHGTAPLAWGLLVGGLFGAPGDRILLFGRYDAKRWQLLLGVLLFTLFPLLQTRGALSPQFFASWGAVGTAVLHARWQHRARTPRTPPPAKLRVIRGGRDDDAPPRTLH
jgi:membrane associated rhomboid family serine protease